MAETIPLLLAGAPDAFMSEVARRFAPPDNGVSVGTYLSAEYQFARRWYAGGRLDHSGRVTDGASIDNGESAFLTFWPTGFEPDPRTVPAHPVCRRRARERVSGAAQFFNRRARRPRVLS